MIYLRVKRVGFLNGVCRHEHGEIALAYKADFLNGVCRHKRFNAKIEDELDFLNGVCRHEPLYTIKSSIL